MYITLHPILHTFTHKYDAHAVFKQKAVQCNTEGVTHSNRRIHPTRTQEDLSPSSYLLDIGIE